MGNREFSASLIQQKIKITQYKFFLKKGSAMGIDSISDPRNGGGHKSWNVLLRLMYFLLKRLGGNPLEE